jgi:hypothetical protein
MSFRAVPLIVFALLFYNAIVFFPMFLAGGASPGQVLGTRLFEIGMIHGTPWEFTRGDFVVLLVLALLFVELLKSTYTTAVSLLDHGLSMLVFIACLVEFLMVKQAASSVFFFITVASLIDVIAGYTIGIRTARRDLQIGSD